MTLRTSDPGQQVRQYLSIASACQHDVPRPGADPVTARYYNQLDVVVNDGSVNLVSETQFAMVFNLAMTRDGVTRPSSWYVDDQYERQRSDILFHPENGFDDDFSGSFKNGAAGIALDLASGRYRPVHVPPVT